MKTSVAMATYNGEKYIVEQLESLLSQSRMIDEVVICDDGSTDKTVNLINEFIDNNRLNSKWYLYQNKINKGYTMNFLDCAEMVEGDVIYFCDQDDIWDKNKIDIMNNIYENNSNVKALGCTMTVIDENGESCNKLINKLRIGNGKLGKIEFAKQVKNNISVGLTLSVRKEILKEIRPIIEKYNLPFDVPIGLFASVFGGYYILGVPLVKRRVHNNNVSAPKYSLNSRLKDVQRHIKGREENLKLLKACFNETSNVLSVKDKKNLEKTISKKEENIKNLKERNIISLFAQCFDINPMTNYILSLTNLVCAIFGNYSEVD